MSKVIWSAGVTVLVLSLLGAAWLRRPVEPSALAAETSDEPLPPPALPGPQPSAPVPAFTTLPPATRAPRPDTKHLPTPDALPSRAPPKPGEDMPAPDARPTRALRRPAETRVRVVTALRGAHATPDARREAVLAELTTSGESDAPWTSDARAALDTWRARVETDVLPVRAEPPRCFAAGCVTRVTFPDAASFDASFQRTAELKLGTASAHLQLPPERLPSGEVVAAWVVLPPDMP